MLNGKGSAGVGAEQSSGFSWKSTNQSCGLLHDRACLSGDRRLAEGTGADEGDNRRVREPGVDSDVSSGVVSARGVAPGGGVAGGAIEGALDEGRWKGTGGGSRALAASRSLVRRTKELESPMLFPL